MGLALCYNLILSSNKLYFDNGMILLNHITKVHKIIEHKNAEATLQLKKKFSESTGFCNIFILLLFP